MGKPQTKNRITKIGETVKAAVFFILCAKTAQDLIAELKKNTGGDEKLQGKITEYETAISTLQNQLKEEKLESAVKITLLEADGKDSDYITFKLKEKGECSCTVKKQETENKR